MLNLTKCFDIMMEATLRKNLGSPMPKQNNDSGNPRSVGNMHVFVAGQTDVLNKQLVSPLVTPLSETSLGESYILTIYRHLDAKKKHSLDVEEIYNM